MKKTFAAAHNLRGYKGKCEDLHGHNYKVRVVLAGKELDHVGLLYDFVHLKQVIRGVIASLDHKYLNELPPFDEINPSAENIARHIYDKLRSRYARRPTARGSAASRCGRRKRRRRPTGRSRSSQERTREAGSIVMVITEIFKSIQGEGTRAGLPCIFVRLTGCNLRCTWCDTAYAFHGGTKHTVDEILDRVRSLAGDA